MMRDFNFVVADDLRRLPGSVTTGHCCSVAKQAERHYVTQFSVRPPQSDEFVGLPIIVR